MFRPTPASCETPPNAFSVRRQSACALRDLAPAYAFPSLDQRNSRSLRLEPTYLVFPRAGLATIALGLFVRLTSVFETLDPAMQPLEFPGSEPRKVLPYTFLSSTYPELFH
jgi:hypothetical protein